MAFDPQSFRSAMAFDGARPNLFEMKMSFPEFASSGFGQRTGTDGLSLNEQFTFFARSSQLPGSTVNPVTLNYMGREVKVPGNRTFPELSVTIFNDEDFKVRSALEKWLNGMNSHRGNLRDQSMINSTGWGRSAHVIQYAKSGEALKSYTFIGLFPIDISPIDMDWASNDVVEEYACTFAYQWWEQTEGESHGTGGEAPTRNVSII
jgi:hypothetical protein